MRGCGKNNHEPKQKKIKQKSNKKLKGKVKGIRKGKRGKKRKKKGKRGKEKEKRRKKKDFFLTMYTKFGSQKNTQNLFVGKI